MEQYKFNYVKVFNIDGTILKEGSVNHWEAAFNGNMIDLSFTDESIIKAPSQYVFLFNENTTDTE